MLDDAEFHALRRMIQELSGIQLDERKRTLVTGRLTKRLRAHQLHSFAEYIEYVRADSSGDESRHLINCITTNKTSFFRESHHFDFLERTVAPALIERARQTGRKRIRIWSAGCSTGEEPWSIALVLRKIFGASPDWDIRILASDLDTDVLARASEGVYDEGVLADVPQELCTSGLEFLGDGRFSVGNWLRERVVFRQINLVARPWPVRARFDLIFCRNVAIYFDRPTQEALFRDLAGKLEDTGYLLSGHSENLQRLSDMLVPLGQTVHALRHARNTVAATPPAPTASQPGEVAISAGELHASARGETIRTLLGSCVSVCLHDPVARVGGMNHFMLPDGASPTRSTASFGVNAMELLIEAVTKLGADRSRLIAKVFGASTLQGTAAGRAVSEQNAAFARECLADKRIPVVAEKLGDSLPLLVRFDSATGRVLVRTIASTEAEFSSFVDGRAA